MLKAHLKHMCSDEQDLPTKASTVAAVNVNQYCLLKNAQRSLNSEDSSDMETKPGGHSFSHLVGYRTKEVM